jgi:hypothetical protein
MLNLLILTRTFVKRFCRRATGQLITPATWIRQFVQSHPVYQHDSVIRPEIAHDLLMACKGIGEGSVPCVEILGDINIDRYVLWLRCVPA